MATIYYRKSLMEASEFEVAKKYFKVENLLTNLPSDELIIGRYSLLPFYPDQEKEVKNINSRLINNYNEYLYIADLQNYVYDLEGLTPKTWQNLYDLPEDRSFVLKGETNSRKSNWLKDMFAVDKKAAIEVYNRLSNDSLIGYQKIYIREYIPLFKYMDGINGMPVTKEFRFFVAYNTLLCGEYYWQNYIDDLPEHPNADEVPREFLQKVMDRVGSKSNFYTIDVGQTASGEWIVIELNDGQCAGLSCNDPEKLYLNLYNVIKEK